MSDTIWNTICHLFLIKILYDRIFIFKFRKVRNKVVANGRSQGMNPSYTWNTFHFGLWLLYSFISAMFTEHLIHAEKLWVTISLFIWNSVLFLLIHGEQQDLQKSWKGVYDAKLAILPLWNSLFILDGLKCSNKIKYLLGVWHRLEN